MASFFPSSTTSTPPYSWHPEVYVAQFLPGQATALVSSPLVASWGIRNVIGVRIKGYHIKSTGNTTNAIPSTLFLTCNVPGLFPKHTIADVGTMECIPITIQPSIIDATGNVISTGSYEFIHTPGIELTYGKDGFNGKEITIPKEFRLGLGVFRNTVLAAILPAPYDWPCSNLLNVAGESTVTLELMISHQGEKKSFTQKQAIGYGHTSNI